MRILKFSSGFVKFSAIDAMETEVYGNDTKVVRIYLNGGEYIDLEVRNLAIGCRKIEKVMEILMSFDNKGSNIINWEEL